MFEHIESFAKKVQALSGSIGPRMDDMKGLDFLYNESPPPLNFKPNAMAQHCTCISSTIIKSWLLTNASTSSMEVDLENVSSFSTLAHMLAKLRNAWACNVEFHFYPESQIKSDSFISITRPRLPIGPHSFSLRTVKVLLPYQWRFFGFETVSHLSREELLINFKDDLATAMSHVLKRHRTASINVGGARALAYYLSLQIGYLPSGMVLDQHLIQILGLDPGTSVRFGIPLLCADSTYYYAPPSILHFSF